MIKQFQITKLDVRKLIGGESRTLEVQQYPGELDEVMIKWKLFCSLQGFLTSQLAKLGQTLMVPRKTVAIAETSINGSTEMMKFPPPQ